MQQVSHEDCWGRYGCHERLNGRKSIQDDKEYNYKWSSYEWDERWPQEETYRLGDRWDKTIQK